MPAPSVLSISAADPGGGLLAADLLAFGALGLAGAGVVSATTAWGIRQAGPVHDVPVAVLRASLEAVLGPSSPDAIKVGVLTTVPAVRTVSRALATVTAPHVVEPGFAPRSGVRLLRPSVLE